MLPWLFWLLCTKPCSPGGQFASDSSPSRASTLQVSSMWQAAQCSELMSPNIYMLKKLSRSIQGACTSWPYSSCSSNQKGKKMLSNSQKHVSIYWHKSSWSACKATGHQHCQHQKQHKCSERTCSKQHIKCWDKRLSMSYIYSHSNSHAGSIKTATRSRVYDTTVLQQIARHLPLQIAVLAQAVASSSMSLPLN